MENKEIQSALSQAVTTINTLQGVITKMQPMAELGQMVVDDDGLYSMRDAADHLYDRTGLGRNSFMAWLRKLGVLSVTPSEKNVPKVEFIKRGYFEIKRGPKPGNTPGMWKQTFVTGKGMAWLIKLWDKYGE